ncbi:MAG: metal-dependent hydrolase [Thermoplasmata archaeon]|nr:MAG: metal-dependent hydrolase [Thermoplasmata archaeon]
MSICGELFINIFGIVIYFGAKYMQPIIHFLLSMVAGLGVGLHLLNKTKKFLLIILLAVFATCIDLDHFLPIYQETGVKVFHNIFVFILLPSALFLIFFVYEKNKGTSIGQRSCISLCVMFLGHMFLDSFHGSTLPFLYPIRPGLFTLGSLGFTVDSSFLSLTSEQVILIIWGGIIFCSNLVETVIFNDIEGREYQAIRSNQKKNTKTHPIAVLSGGFSLIKINILNRFWNNVKS